MQCNAGMVGSVMRCSARYGKAGWDRIGYARLDSVLLGKDRYRSAGTVMFGWFVYAVR